MTSRGRFGVIPAVVVLAYVATLVAAASPLGAAVTLATHGLMIVPGLVAIALIAPGNWLAAVTFGPMIGLAFSTAAMLGLWAAGARSGWVIVGGPIVAIIVALPLRRLRDRWRLPMPSAGEARVWLLLLLLVPLVVGRPFARVGQIRPEGQVYRAYFTADYVWRRALVAEIAKGEFPPQNPYYNHDQLHYYWLGHLPDAIEYRALADRIDLDALLLGSSVIVDAAFVSVIYGLTRLVVTVPWAAAAAVGWAFLFTSFEGAAALWHIQSGTLPVYSLRELNIDALSRWVYGGMPIDGLQRILWYQPHHAMAYALGWLGLVAVAYRRDDHDRGVFFTAGLIFAVCILLSSFVALMAVLATAMYETVRTVRRRSWYAAIGNAAFAALPIAVAVAISEVLQYIDHQPGTLPVLRLGLNLFATQRTLLVTFVSAGPILIVGAAGGWAAWRHRVAGASPFVAVLATAVWVYFYLDIRDHQDVYVGWRVGHTVFIALAPFVGVALLAAARARGTKALAAWGSVGLLACLAAPMVVIDFINTQDVDNRAMGPSFRWTLVLTPAEREGLAWLRTHTSPAARVQVDPWSRNTDTWAYIPAFAERRMAVGLPLGLVPLHKYEEGSRRVRWLYDTDPLGAYELAARNGIDYVVVGAEERHDHPRVDERLAQVPTLMPQVFHNDALTVYEVLRPDHVH